MWYNFAMDKSKSKNLTKDITRIALFVALMIVFTLYVSIPFFPVPLTFQTVICVCAGLFLGKRKGAISMAIYLFMGLVCHLPVFSGGTGGFSSVFKPSFGYIIGFVLAAYAAGAVRGDRNASTKRYILAAAVGFACCYAVGIPYFAIIWKFYLGKADILPAIISYNVLYMPKDIALCVLAALVAKRIVPVIFRNKDTSTATKTL